MSSDAWGAVWVLVAVAGTAAVWLVLHRLTTATVDRRGNYGPLGTLLKIVTILIGVITVVLVLPVDGQVKGALVGAIGVTVAAIIGLSSTTIVGNALAGLMLRSVDNFDDSDWIMVEGHVGKVTLRRLLATEIETEDSDLVTLPNLFLTTHPVKVVKRSGTFVSATVSIGYDVHPDRLEPLFDAAAERIGLTKRFTYVLDLGDHAITYRVAGKLEQVDSLLTTRSKLRVAIFDVLNDAGIEIVSPNFMNQRAVGTERVRADRPRPVAAVGDAPDPEEFVFEKDSKGRAAKELRDRLAEAESRCRRLEEQRGAVDADDAADIDRRLAIATSEVAALQRQLEHSEAELDGNGP